MRGGFRRGEKESGGLHSVYIYKVGAGVERVINTPKWNEIGFFNLDFDSQFGI